MHTTVFKCRNEKWILNILSVLSALLLQLIGVSKQSSLKLQAAVHCSDKQEVSPETIAIAMLQSQCVFTLEKLAYECFAHKTESLNLALGNLTKC